MPEAAFEAVDVSRSYPGGQTLRGVSLRGYRGELLALSGAEGASKSSLARLISGRCTGQYVSTGLNSPRLATDEVISWLKTWPRAGRRPPTCRSSRTRRPLPSAARMSATPTMPTASSGAGT